MILLYSSIVGYDRQAIISLGRGISIYRGLFLLQLLIQINCIRKFASTRFWIDQGVTPHTALDNQGLKIKEGLLSEEISGLSIRLSNKLNEKGLMFNWSPNYWLKVIKKEGITILAQ